MRISVFLPLALGLIIMLEGAYTFLIIFSAAAIHELGHLFFVRVCGARVVRTDIEVMGALIVYAEGDTDLNADIAIAMGGIVFNICAGLTGIACFYFNRNIDILIFITANFMLAFINMLPVSSLDGGRAMSAIFMKRFDIVKADTLSHRISFLSKVFLVAITGALVILSGFNTALVLLLLLNFVQINN